MSLSELFGGFGCSNSLLELVGELRVDTDNVINESLFGLYRSKKYADCKFLVGKEKKVVSAHKLILAAVSRKLELLVYHAKAEDTIEIPDVEEDTVHHLLFYIYTGKMPLHDRLKQDAILDIWYLSCKYGLEELSQGCLEKLHVNSDNCMSVYNVCAKLDRSSCRKIREYCFKRIIIMTLDVLKSPNFNLVESSLLEEIFSIQNMNISEVELFNALDRYSEHHGWKATDAFFSEEELAGNTQVLNARIKDIRKALKQIRYLKMSPEEFNVGPAKSGRLTKQEVTSIRDCISSNMMQGSLPAGFTSKRDQRYTTLRINRFSSGEAPEEKTKSASRAIFSVKVMTSDVPVGVTETFSLVKANWQLIFASNSEWQTTSRRMLSVALYCDGIESYDDSNWKRYAQVDFIIRNMNEEKIHYDNLPWFCFQSGHQYNLGKQMIMCENKAYVIVEVNMEASLIHTRTNTDSKVSVKYDRNFHYGN